MNQEEILKHNNMQIRTESCGEFGMQSEERKEGHKVPSGKEELVPRIFKWIIVGIKPLQFLDSHLTHLQ